MGESILGRDLKTHSEIYKVCIDGERNILGDFLKME